MLENRRKSWMSSKPDACDLCGRSVKDQFVDGKTQLGPWAIMCMTCHADNGCSLGIGRGQHYVLEADGIYYKVAG